MKKVLITIAVIAAAAAVAAIIFWKDVAAGLKARGFIPYTPVEAQELAHKKCTQCHDTEKIAKYCMRCGPPLVVIVHNMNTLTRLERERGRTALEEMTGAEAVAIAQVWNALVGNWEATWREEDLVKLLENDGPLIELVKTPVKDRPIETGLAGKSAPGAYKEEMGQMGSAPEQKD